MRNFFLFLVLFAIISANAQETKTDSIIGWSKSGNASLMFSQSAFNAEWQGGGTSNYSLNAAINYNFNYKKENFTWDNKIIGEYGVTKTENDEFLRKTNDRFEFSSIAGKQIKETNWYYSLFFNLKTQFAPGYEYYEADILDPTTGDVLGTETLREKTTHAFSPAYLQFGPGLLWKKSDNLKVNIAPLTSRLIIVDKDFTSGAGYVDGDYFGVDKGESTRFEFGASLNAYAKFTLMENVSMENSLALYSNYLEDPQNVDLDYTMNLVLGINNYLSATVVFQAIYDDNAIQAFQIREVLGVGLAYTFPTSKEK